MAGSIDLIYTITCRYSESRKDLTRCWNQRVIETIWTYTRSYRLCKKRMITGDRCRNNQRCNSIRNLKKKQTFGYSYHFRKWNRWCARFYAQIGRWCSMYSDARNQRIAQCRSEFCYFYASMQPDIEISIKACYFVKNMYSIFKQKNKLKKIKKIWLC